MESNQFFTVFKWMVTELGLKGNSLSIYAIIYGFSQGRDGEYTGSLRYLAEFIGASRQSVINCLTELVNNGHLIKREEYIRGVKYCKYRAVRPRDLATNPYAVRNIDKCMQDSCQLGIKENSSMCATFSENTGNNSLPNNIGLDIDNCISNSDISEKKSKRKADSAKKQEMDEIISSYNFSDDVKDAIYAFIENRKEMKNPMTTIGLKQMLNKLEKLSSDSDEQVDILNESISCGYRGIFPLRNKKASAGDTPVYVSPKRYKDSNGMFTVSFMRMPNGKQQMTMAYDNGEVKTMEYTDAERPQWIQ